MAPSLDSRQSPQIYMGPNPMQLAGALRKQLSSTAILDRGETGSLPGTTQVDTPILDRVNHFLQYTFFSIENYFVKTRIIDDF